MTTFDPSKRALWAALACGLVLGAGRAHAQGAPGAAQPAAPAAPGAAPAAPDAAPAAPAAAQPAAPGAGSPPGDAAAPQPGAGAAAAEPAAEIPDYDPNEVTQDDLRGLSSDVENFKFQWQRERDLHTARTTRGLLIGGVVQTRVGWSDEAVNSATVNDRRATFSIGAALLSFNGSLYRDYEEGRNLTYQLRFGASPQQATNNSFLNLLDAQISYSPVPTISPEESTLLITLGQQLLPFGLEVPASEELKPVITNAQFTSRLGLARRDIGLIIRGDLFPQVDYGYDYRVGTLAYAFGVIDGNGPNTTDDNTEKDFIGRLAFTVPTDYHSWLRQITLGGSVYFGWQNTFLKDEKKTLSGKGIKRRYGADLYYNHFPFGITYEFIYGQDEVTLGTTAEDPRKTELQSVSHVATFFYSFGAQFLKSMRNQGRYDDWWPKTYQPFIRIDTFDPDIDQARSRVDTYTLGLNVFFAETSKFQLNYNRRNDRADTLGAGNEVLAQLQGGF